jgi:hypothetical protein
MFRFIRPSLIKRFTHTHSKTFFPENNSKVMEDLIRQQNEGLTEITKTLNGLVISVLLTCVTIAWKPMR